MFPRKSHSPGQSEAASANVQRCVPVTIVTELDVVWLVVLSKYMLRVSVEAHGQGFDIIRKASLRKKVYQTELGQIKDYQTRSRHTLEELLSTHCDEGLAFEVTCTER